ncbi:hypothetical protein F2Q70_00042314 [Brassica cretica]|uniref:BnaC06g00700D protein n=5 Tax=Brassica TaxID=3705 RepID=A0A078FHU6_BRANA|nr:PREDICTED: uncharacterized protein LOC106299396 [Brassica oleracea var. oleracea]XP_013664009.1 uncharacterized protein BNAC06G00700D [Brassica napus]KAF2594054.1 hypothetical protein F2Q70_00042314 [Brassica cretica]KAG2250192.1 hypothetical protein Bca52824_080328 [Brassica carinata]KAF3516484.1 hypothetical protein DY000_02058550 [Brassica cretica]KAH0871979.1 hypothetical protein HID58_069341 [Brassica napus]CAF2053734.1 unnamed protein product [Brassica napus]
MKGQNQSSTSSCNIHPIDFVEGVCPICLNERLLVLAYLQRRHAPSPSPSYHTIQEPKINSQKSSKKKNIRLFSFLGSFQLRHHNSDHRANSIISPEDSFISINFENNGTTSWEKEKESYQLEHSTASCDHQYQHITKKEIILRLMQRPLLTWSKRIGRLIHVISFRRRSSAKVKGDDGLSRSCLKPSPLTNKKTQSLESFV